MNMLTIGARKKLKLAFWQILRCTRPWSKIYFKACLWKSLPVRGPHASNYFFLSTLEDFQREMLSISHWRAPSAALVRNDNGSRFDCWWALRLLCISVIKSLSFHNIAGVDYFDLRLINRLQLVKGQTIYVRKEGGCNGSRTCGDRSSRSPELLPRLCCS